MGCVSPQMSDDLRELPLGETAEELRAKLAETVKRSLVAIGDMREIEEQMVRLTERIKKLPRLSERAQD